MFIAHLPAGYVVSTLLQHRFVRWQVSAGQCLGAGMLGAIAPDFDMFYFYLVDHRRHHHHAYFTHFPLVWLGLLLLACAWLLLSRVRTRAALALLFALNGLIHLFLDTIVGDIWWLAPFVDQPFAFFTVPARYHPWWLNFLLHWSFGLEMLIVSIALYQWHRRNRLGGI